MADKTTPETVHKMAEKTHKTPTAVTTQMRMATFVTRRSFQHAENYFESLYS